MSALLVLAQQVRLSETLREAFVQAYGKPIKWACIIILCIVLLGPVLGFLRRMMR